jgi:hypothetical protein
MADTFSTSLEFRLQSVGGNNNTWGSLLNTTLSNIDAALGGVAQISLASADVTLSTAQNRNPVIEVTGTLPADRDLVVKTQTKAFWIKNSTSGAYTVTVKTAAGTGVEVPQGEWRLVYCDGTNVETITGSLASYDSIVAALIDSDAITTDKILNANVTFEKLAMAIQDSLADPGDIKFTAATIEPDGWLLCLDRRSAEPPTQTCSWQLAPLTVLVTERRRSICLMCGAVPLPARITWGARLPTG